jgi:ubiquinone/menaquinone biosynthesis C-methylase UbiE
MGRAESMREDWDARAREDAFYYIASWRKDWDVADFLKSGDEDYERLVKPALDRAGFAPAGKAMLELGCGAGRMTHSFALQFDRVIALDISAQMLDRARKILQSAGNIEWRQANGVDLRGVPNESMDFAFSYLVLQHLPDGKSVFSYIRELMRVLREQGICLFQFNGMKKPTMNWKGNLTWKFIDGLWALHLTALSRSVARILGFDPNIAGKSWRGTAITIRSIVEVVKACGGSVLEVQGEDTPMVWCCARKLAGSSANDASS